MQQTHHFTEELWNYYAAHSRDSLPWRQPEADGSFDPYKIMVSELMLQQTQVSRIIPKFHEFLLKFPDVASLAAATQGEVLLVWSGLGYNRRPKFLHQAAQRIMNDFDGHVPADPEALVSLPGIGKNTAGAILAYAYDQPVVFIETNVRTVYIHHFFHDQATVSEKAILELVAQTLDREHPREFYWALMDYGSHLKQTVGNLSKLSSSYAKQSTFQGSKRQIRGQVLRALADGPQTKQDLMKTISDDRLSAVLSDLVNEKLINQSGTRYSL